MVRVRVRRCGFGLRFVLDEVQGTGVCGVDDVIAKRGIEGAAPHPGSAPMIGKLQGSLGRRRRIRALVWYSPALEKLRIPFAAGSLVRWSNVGEVVFREAQPR